MILYYACTMHLYQKTLAWTAPYGYKLNKIAAQKLVGESEGFFRKVVSKTKNWYLVESNKLEVEVSLKKLESFLDNLCHEAGLDTEGSMPFCANSVDWKATDEQEAVPSN
jgi:hypothetical protein